MEILSRAIGLKDSFLELKNHAFDKVGQMVELVLKVLQSIKDTWDKFSFRSFFVFRCFSLFNASLSLKLEVLYLRSYSFLENVYSQVFSPHQKEMASIKKQLESSEELAIKTFDEACLFQMGALNLAESNRQLKSICKKLLSEKKKVEAENLALRGTIIAHKDLTPMIEQLEEFFNKKPEDKEATLFSLQASLAKTYEQQLEKTVSLATSSKSVEVSLEIAAICKKNLELFQQLAVFLKLKTNQAETPPQALELLSTPDLLTRLKSTLERV